MYQSPCQNQDAGAYTPAIRHNSLHFALTYSQLLFESKRYVNNAFSNMYESCPSAMMIGLLYYILG